MGNKGFLSYCKINKRVALIVFPKMQTNILTKRIQKLLIYIEYQLKLIACHRNLNW